ncbi:hypothetical protein Ddye_028724 [Dipteronia dyeriana]|uniref:Uncharacterized protein n=1 Tax=Dipteronia dyeriana TaxID=168575 RepID=A0AAD9WKU8_9ROSI|nr:hypothetical protein Ddye_028724 [Dipteronia dyeriana]
MYCFFNTNGVIDSVWVMTQETGDSSVAPIFLSIKKISNPTHLYSVSYSVRDDDERIYPKEPFLFFSLNPHMDENNNKYGIGGVVDTIKADKSMWLMKCPALVSRSLNNLPPPPPSEEPTRPVAKVILSIDPLHSTDDSSSTQFTMELIGNGCGDAPKRYSMDMSKDVIPMSVFSESSQGKLSIEGKILNKFDLRLHQDSMENYEKLS